MTIAFQFGWRRPGARAWLGACLLGHLAATVAAPVPAALERPALMTTRAPQAVLQAAARAGERLVAVGERGIVLVSDDQGGQWRQVPTPTSVGLTAVQFVDAQHGWVVGHGATVLATNDGGNTWQRRFDGVQAARLLHEAARAAGREADVIETQRWIDEGADKPLLDVHFTDHQHGWVVGAYNMAFATEDGGQTWQPVTHRLDNPKSLHLYTLRARGDTWLIAGEQGLVLLSSDRGRTFRRLRLPYQGSFFTAECLGEHDLLVAGLRGNAWRSRDGGATWRPLTGAPPANLTATAVNDQGQVLLASQAGVVLAVQGEALVPVAEGLSLLNGLLALRGPQGLALSFAGPVRFSSAFTGTVK